MGNAFIVRHGGGGGGTYATIIVTYPSNSVCSCAGATKLDITPTKCIFAVQRAGNYTITATNGTDTTTETVVVSEAGQRVEIQVSYLVPAAYQAVNYLESTGSQYITLSTAPSGIDPIVPGTTFSIELYASGLGNATGGSANPVFGIVASGFSLDCTYTAHTGGVFAFHAYDGSWNTPTQTSPKGEKRLLRYSSTPTGYTFSVEENSVSVTKTVKEANSFHLFAYQGSTFYKGINRIWSGKIYNEGVHVSTLQACYLRADRTPGFWDKKRGCFVTNSGTGVFTVGEDIIE